MTPLDIISARHGTYIMNGASSFAFLFAGGFVEIVVLEETDFGQLLSFKGQAVDQRSTYLFANAKVPAGSIIRPTNDDYFKSLTITKGSVAIVFGESNLV